MPFGPWRHILASFFLGILPSCLSSRSSKGDCLTTSHGFLIRSADVLGGGSIGRSSVGRIGFPLSRFVEDESEVGCSLPAEPFVTAFLCW